MPTNNQHPSQPRQVNLAQKAGIRGAAVPRGGPNKPKKRKTSKNKVVISILAVVILLILAFLILGVRYVYDTIMPQKTSIPIDPASHVTTPETDQEKVAYYVIGLLGADNSSPAEMMSILCYDKGKKTVNILQVPQDTYLGESGQWAVKRVSDVWNNPKPLNWCETCRKEVPDSEIKDGKHTLDGTPITQKTGSASEDLCDVFNDQYGLPVDGYFIIPQDTLVKLTNLLGGINVNLGASMTVNDIKYGAGDQILDGNAALYLMTNHASGISGDIDRLLNQRKVMLALFQRLARQTEAQLTNDSIGPLMNGSTPIKSDLDREDMIKILLEMNSVKPSSMTAYVLPGESAKKSGTTYFSVHKGDLLTLLNDSFRPYGEKLTDDNLGLTEISTKATADEHKQVLSDIAVQQSGEITTTASAGETTTTAKAS